MLESKEDTWFEMENEEGFIVKMDEKVKVEKHVIFPNQKVKEILKTNNPFEVLKDKFGKNKK